VVNTSSLAKVNDDKDVTAHSGWSRNEFHFDNTSLAEIGASHRRYFMVTRWKRRILPYSSFLFRDLRAPMYRTGESAGSDVEGNDAHTEQDHLCDETLITRLLHILSDLL